MVEPALTTGIDHPIIALSDMAAGRAAYERLGFTVTPRGRHREWGTGNWCIMFERDYMELRGIIDPASPHNLAEILKKREGLMGMAFSTNDAAASSMHLSEGGLHPQHVRQLTRDFEVPDGPLEPRFALTFLNADETPGLMSVVLCQHLTPELVRRPEWLRHANGVTGVRSLTSIVPHLEPVAEHYARMFGEHAIEFGREKFTIRLNDRQSLDFLTPNAARASWPHVDLAGFEDLGCLAAVALYVADIAATQAYFTKQGIDFSLADPGVLRTSAGDACGVPFEFTAN